MSGARRRLMAAALLTPLAFGGAAVSAAEEAGLIARTTQAFVDSDFEFQRSISNVPFPPVAFLSGAAYSEAEVEGPAGNAIEYDVNRVSQMAAMPFLLGKRDALVVGEYLSLTEFDLKDVGVDDIQVKSVGIPLGWMRQEGPDRQYGAFLMPLGHDSDIRGSDWSWQYLGGGFARFIESDHLWWAVGFYADVGDGDDFYVPYLGASWAINQHWTLSALMPWPAVIYAPSSNWMLRLGATPSGASWSLGLERGDVGVNLDSWDFGLGAEYRAYGNFWLGAEFGVGGLRGMRLENGRLEEPDLDFSSNAYLRVSVKFRPGLSM